MNHLTLEENGIVVTNLCYFEVVLTCSLVFEHVRQIFHTLSCRMTYGEGVFWNVCGKILDQMFFGISVEKPILCDGIGKVWLQEFTMLCDANAWYNRYETEWANVQCSSVITGNLSQNKQTKYCVANPLHKFRNRKLFLVFTIEHNFMLVKIFQMPQRIHALQTYHRKTVGQ